MKTKLLIIANNNIGTSQSGGDTIFLEFIKNWQKSIDITVFGCQETKKLLERYNLKPKFIKTDSINNRSEPTVFNLVLHCLRRIVAGKRAYIKHQTIFKKADYCYTVSDFIPDFYFGYLYKKINPQGQWLCGQYLFAPKPGTKNTPYHHQSLKGYLYYFFQLFTQPISRKYADQILITSAPDAYRFPRKKTIIVQGGVDTKMAQKYLSSSKIIPPNKRRFDAVFQGRLHPQKGAVELIDIWKLVVKKIPQAQLAIIGDGQLENEINEKIIQNKLTHNISMLGFKTGEDKYQIFKDSKIVVHPAIYDSGGMAAAEAMAWSLPGVSFDLEALKTYYPKGMLKSINGNYQSFANNIIELLQNKTLYKKTSLEALELINNVWDWSKRAKNLKKEIFHD